MSGSTVYTVRPPGPGAGEVARGLQVSHDGLDGAFGEAGDGGDVPDPGIGVAGDLHEHVPVPGQQRPGTRALVRLAHALDYISRGTIIARLNA